MGTVVSREEIQFRRSVDLLLSNLAQKGIILDVDPDVIEAIGFVDETAISDEEAEQGYISEAPLYDEEEAR